MKVDWEDLPQIMKPIDFAKLTGMSEQNAKKIYHLKTFPRIPGTKLLLADKWAVMWWCRGVDVDTAMMSEEVKDYIKEVI